MILEREYSGGPEGTNVAWRGVKQLWEQQLLCDVRLLVEGTIFQVHRCYLASCCQYFHAMFTKGFKESSETDVEMPGITAKGLDAVLRYMYTGTISINQDRIQDILETASFLQAEDVLTFCAQYLKDCLTVDTCIDFLTIAEFYALQNTSKEIMTYISENYLSFSRTRVFFEKTDIDQLCQLLTSDELCAESEFKVFQSVVQWLSKERMSYARRVLELIRFGLMKEEEMGLLKDHPVFMQPGCTDLLQQAVAYHTNIYEQPVIDSIIAQPRSYTHSLVLIRDDNEGACDVEMVGSPLDKKDLIGFSSVGVPGPLSEPRVCVAATVLNNFVFIAGGVTIEDDEKQKSIFRYNPTKAEWLQLASMSVARHSFVFVALSDCLVAVGGEHDNSVEKYNFKRNNWTSLPCLQEYANSFAGCVNHGCVYISGGIYVSNADMIDASTDVQCFEPARGEWIKKSGMNRGRRAHVMASARDKIVACGGLGDNNHSMPVLEIEIYDTTTDQWSIVARMPFPRIYAAATCIDNSMYVTEGEQLLEVEMGENDYPIWRFDIDTLQWIGLRPYQTGDTEDVIAAFLKIPTKMYDKK